MRPTSRWASLWRLILARRQKLIGLFVAVLLPLILFGVLADEVLERQSIFLDDPLLLYLHNRATARWDTFMVLISALGYKWGVIPLDIAVLLVLLYWRRRRDSVFFGLAVIGSGALNQAAKAVFGRERPKLWPSVAPESTFSFPSGHAMLSTALVVALVVLLWPTRWRYPMLLLGGLFVALVGLSRVYLGVHYPSDIIAGWVASFAWVMGLSSILYGRLGRPPTAVARPAAR